MELKLVNSIHQQIHHYLVLEIKAVKVVAAAVKYIRTLYTANDLDEIRKFPLPQKKQQQKNELKRNLK